MPGPKKDRKNGKESGGVVAAVTKHGAKFTNGDPAKDSSSSASPVISPEIKPVSVSSNENPVASPLLDAVSNASYATSNNSLNTGEWQRGIPGMMAGSPSNLISLSGESPPTAPSSYEDSRALSSRYGSPAPGMSVYPGHPLSASPSTAGRRPLSYHMEQHYSPSPPDLPSHFGAAAVAARRGSMHSHYSQSRAVSNPPLPHQPQAHFYGVPDIDLDPQPRSGIKAGEKGYFFGYDALPSASIDYGSGKDTVVLAGYEGGLEVFSVGKRGVESVTSLKGLRGGVYHAKVLPWTSDGSELFPLVAVVIHGPNIPMSTPTLNLEGDYDAVSAERSEAMANISPDPSARESVGSRMTAGFVETYQTTVEVYSLKTGQQVSVLLESPKTAPLKTPITSPYFKPPPPIGALTIHADSGNLVVSSGITGECWVYREIPPSKERPIQFRCYGKVWTTLQQPLKGDSGPEHERGRAPASALPRPRPQVAVVSLSSRWLAYCPAAPSSQIALRATVPVATSARAPGLTSMTPPQLPSVNAEVDLPLAESVVNKIMRDATQELIQGAKWVGKQGWHAWNSYWNPQQNQSQRSPPQQPQNWGLGASPPQFPPTHGAITPPVAKEPGLVSILDIEALGSSTNLHPVATFTIHHGCSFLSMSPSGLHLFTASSKGDIQTVWDLMRIQHTKASPLHAANSPSASTPRVRQVAQFSRMTVARIVDLAWVSPNGERAAMVTERGTVHLLDLPSSAFTWPPPRRRELEETKSPAPEGSTSAASIASNALSSVREVARPLIDRHRRTSSNSQSMAGPGIGEYATHGGKVIVAGISHSLGRTGNAISQLRHTGENRVSLPSSVTSPEPSCVTWVVGKRDRSLFVLGTGLVRTFTFKTRRTTSGADKQRLSRYRDFHLPSLPDDTIAPIVKRIVDPDEYIDFGDSDAGNNTLVLNQARPRLRQYRPSAESSIPHAEIESSAPYQPFHTDRRVGMFEVDSTEDSGLAITSILAGTTLEDNTSTEAVPRKKKGAKAAPIQRDVSDISDSAGSWAFGQPLAATRLDFGLSTLPDEESFNIALDASRALPSSAMERILHRSGDDDTQIVITTRRRRGAGRADDEDGFFEDDCEVLDFADQRV
ncbi:hypothetical protein QBC43DRAFT_31616 [Cladorrhinum sp. PSN259]|nr:hypothetical protein QBC43DRAFT_31616 [Cladorrhinum sp. PSN259]